MTIHTTLTHKRGSGIKTTFRVLAASLLISSTLMATPSILALAAEAPSINTDISYAQEFGSLEEMPVESTMHIESPFSDVVYVDENTPWYYNDVMAMYKAGVINGRPDGTFAPNAEVTVAEAIKLAAVARNVYYGEPIVEIDPNSSHWVESFYNFARNNGILENVSFSTLDYNSPISRENMVHLFAHVLNDSDYIQINDISNSEYTSITDADVIRLYNAGIFIGSNNGLQLKDNISRSQTAAIIHRVLNRAACQNTGTLNTLVTPDNPFTGTHQATMPRTLYVNEGDMVNASRISDTYFDGSSQINVKYNHTYYCANQEEYDAVIDLVEEAYDFIMTDYELPKSLAQYFNGERTEEDLIKQGTDRYIIQTFSGEAQKEALITYAQYSQILNYVKKLAKTRKVPTTSNNVGTSAYAALFGKYDSFSCEATSALNMAIFDVMGLNSAAYVSKSANHTSAAVELNGVWFINWAQAGGFNTLEAAMTANSDLHLSVYETFSPELNGVGFYNK